MALDAPERHPETREVVQWFEYEHLKGAPREVSLRCADLVSDILAAIPGDSTELAVGLRKLLEAKDAFVRCAVKTERY